MFPLRSSVAATARGAPQDYCVAAITTTVATVATATTPPLPSPTPRSTNTTIILGAAHVGLNYYNDMPPLGPGSDEEASDNDEDDHDDEQMMHLP